MLEFSASTENLSSLIIICLITVAKYSVSDLLNDIVKTIKAFIDFLITKHQFKDLEVAVNYLCEICIDKLQAYSKQSNLLFECLITTLET